jgi:hypothetical protein
MGKHPLFGKTKRTRDIDGKGIRNTATGVRYQKSPYYLWWRALRLSRKYKDVCWKQGKVDDAKLAQVYRDFGDVSSREFEPWWRERGAKLFGEPPAPMGVSLIDLGEIENYRASAQSGQVLLIAIPLFLTKREIKSAVGRIVKQNHPGKRGRSAVSTRTTMSKAKYKLQTYKSIDAIAGALEVVEQRQAGKLLREIGGDVEQNPSVSRQERMGKTLIKNAERGKFPVTRD